ncbi:hypothetical protein K488DRAFT_55393 [Vararia minispora EC-137]|uniref:Uncharacterized protein n=1 Tax=Vararia minispora EC-137 TaxID=1314806 RepID=A0ACB8QDJ6_9AGAM|nr:hypothetical protein K488DRAFT_55393 [Vararia minispora EC-137]
MSSVEPANVPFFKKKRSRPTTARQRSASPEAPSTSGPIASSSKSTVVLPTRKAGGNLLSTGTKRTASQRQEGDASEDEGRRDGPSVNWGAAGSHVDAAREILDGDEAEAVLAKRRRAETSGPEPTADDGFYHGQKAYMTHIRKNQEVPKAMRTGPQRSSTSTIRTVTIVDYQPDVCKDYKETGFCGFGDTCKFLHDRGTYLAGWQLDKLAANPQAGNDTEDSSSDDEDIPFACLICRKSYTDPVVTRCGHYFCSACAIKRFARTPKCLACGAPTGGIFNRADKIMEKVKKMKDKQRGSDGEIGDDTPGDEVRIEGLAGTNEQESGSDDDSGQED